MTTVDESAIENDRTDRAILGAYAALKDETKNFSDLPETYMAIGVARPFPQEFALVLISMADEIVERRGVEWARGVMEARQ